MTKWRVTSTGGTVFYVDAGPKFSDAARAARRRFGLRARDITSMLAATAPKEHNTQEKP